MSKLITHKVNKTLDNKNLFIRLFFLISFIFLGILIGQMIIKFLLSFFDIMDPQEILASPNLLSAENARYKPSLLISQATLSICIFIVGPLLYWKIVEKQHVHHWFLGAKKQHLSLTICIALLMIATMIAVNMVVYWNLKLQMPDFLIAFEKWAQAKEAALQQLTTYLTTFSSVLDFLTTLLVVAVIAAIGEEMLFRGIVQPLFFQCFKNRSMAIIASAFIFSVVHFQFYGFFPRLLLGILFGYLYEWTKNLYYPMVAHFFNNFFSLVIAFLAQKGYISNDMSTTHMEKPPFMEILFAGIVAFILLFYIRIRSKRRLHTSQ